MINNLALYGGQPVSDIEALPAWRAIHMNTALEEKYKRAAQAQKGRPQR